MTVVVFFSLLAWIYLAVSHGRFWQPLLDPPTDEPHAWPSVDIVVPARNEADVLTQTLPTWLNQDYPGDWRIVLVDDHSADGTGRLALSLAENAGLPSRLRVVAAPDLSPGWSGKVAAMNAGVVQGESDYVLFTDADIAHSPRSLRRLVSRALADNLDLNSLMVKLNCTHLAEKWLIPAFVFFFALLYPFRRASNPKSNVAAAAGGVMLVRRRALIKCGGLARIRNALIDDCSLARIVKDHGGRISLTLTRDVVSLRPYPSVGDIWRMVARTAYTQLDHSPTWLLVSVLGLAWLLVLPVVALLMGEPLTMVLGGATWLLMSLLYWPMVRFYHRSPPWALSLPLAGLAYLGATVDSARRHVLGQGGQWKGRTHDPSDSNPGDSA